MKNMKRSERRYRAKCKLEKRIKIWVRSIDLFLDDDFNKTPMDAGGMAKVKEMVRAGKIWKFLRHTSTPCSCGMCAYNKYKRTPKYQAIKSAMEE